MNLKKQKIFLSLHEALRGFRVAGTIWVVLLLARGFSLADVGLVEAVFHTVSFLCEVPSGMLADLLGRRRTLIAAGLTTALAGAVMAVSTSLPGICLAMGLEALGFNLGSGTLEAITYDSLVQAGDPADYAKWDGRQYACYAAAQALAGLGSFITVKIGFSGAYAAACCVGLATAFAASRLAEPIVTQTQAGRERAALRGLPRRLWAHVRANLGFLLHRPRLAVKMVCVSFVAACCYLMQMFFQQHVVGAGLPAALVGLPLFALMLLDMAGALLGPRMPKRLSALFLVLGLPIAGCIALAGAASLPLSIAAACLAMLLGTAFAVRAASLLQPFYPSDSRATLTSVESMVYSFCMILLSPAAGGMAEVWGTGVCLACVGAVLALMVAVLLLYLRKEHAI